MNANTADSGYLTVSSDANRVSDFDLVLRRFNEASEKPAHGNTGGLNSNSVLSVYQTHHRLHTALAVACDAIRFFTSAGNIVSGEINIEGIRA